MLHKVEGSIDKGEILILLNSFLIFTFLEAEVSETGHVFVLECSYSVSLPEKDELQK